MNGDWNSVEQKLSEVTGKHLRLMHSEPLSGGCINQTLKLSDSDKNYWFIKTNKPSLLNMFEAEAAGLEELSRSKSIRVPKSICSGSSKQFSYLVLEYITLSSQFDQNKAGMQLAQMHQSLAPRFGWQINNYIGSTPQSNTYHNSWVSFWKNERLLPQLNLAKNKGYASKDYDAGIQLAGKLALFFENYQPRPSLLHGDLWGGNCAGDSNQNPVIYDPAVYFGDRETDIAMTELFGGFNADFYAAYNDAYPLDSGYKTRKKLYSLYHILNHYNLFGGSYASQAATMTKQLLAEV